jgi:hypothetical protein
MRLSGNWEFPIPLIRDTEVTEAGIAFFLLRLHLTSYLWLIPADSG